VEDSDKINSTDGKINITPTKTTIDNKAYLESLMADYKDMINHQ